MTLDFLNVSLTPSNWPTFVFVTTRLSGLMLVAPLWSSTAIPKTVRAAVTVMLAVFLLPMTPRVQLPDAALELPLPLAIELAIGLGIGLTAAVIVQAVALAGEVVSLQMGLSLGPALSPMPDLQVSGTGQLKSFLALFIYVGVGGHLMVLRGIADSLGVLPPGTPVDLVAGGRYATALFSAVYAGAVRAAAPAMVTLLLVNVSLAILSRAVPQLNAMMVSLPVTIGVGLLMVGLALPIVAGAIHGWVEAVPTTIVGVLGGFRPGGP